MAIPRIDLSTPTGPVPIPQLGFGMWQVPQESAADTVRLAVDAGYRHIDTARIYDNEAGTGAGIATSGIPRAELFVTTKVWNDDQGRDRTLAAFEASLARLGLDYLDLYLIHWAAPGRGLYAETWETLLDLRASGRLRVAGVSNFHVAHLEDAHARTGEYPPINQIELHPYLQQAPLRAFHAEHGIVTQAWSPLAAGRQVLADPVIAGIASRHACTPAQVILAWHLAIGNVVIPKSVTPARIVENFAAAHVTLDEQDLAAIAGLDRGMRTGPDPDVFGSDS
ncbi:aldo/keto reductase [Nostocoides sp.]|jgi:2,5-diketo-D-gluconate reductase A|uniref:aldo/keto reductase n=1 Tax=Nostocoides sp. TaxID=1917966 RepID=UPI002C9D0279|nr:aldo/keto reductase [Tetrasphaera sp.]